MYKEYDGKYQNKYDSLVFHTVIYSLKVYLKPILFAHYHRAR